MIIEPVDDELLVWAPAKLNLHLEVLRKRPDGYHEIATLMVAVTLFDTLRIKEEPSGKIVLHSDNDDAPANETNLVVRAARLLQSTAKVARGAEIHLEKGIPVAAGLGGGSSDAAATLAALNRLWRLGLGPDRLTALAAQLGSDVPFFLDGPAAWCTGRGEHVEPMAETPLLWFVVVKPPLGLSTAAVYQRVRIPAQPNTGESIRQAFLRGDIEGIRSLLFNRLQYAAEELHPELADWRRKMERHGARQPILSGSGSSCFALCDNDAEASRLAAALRKDAVPGTKVYVVRSCR